ncbi:hypothetical protein [Litorivivens sp.]|uniref:hypothetical protein n=1 Tax=Litorivivens sp. TaxID=2020868 RepID=UPI00356601EF
MHQLAARLLAAIVALLLTLIVIASLVAFSIGYLFDSLVVVMQPIVGHASALGVAGLSGMLLLVLIGFLLRKSLLSPVKFTLQKQKGHASQLDESRALIQKYPLEAATLAFIGGIAAEHPETRELMKSTVRSWLDQGGTT